MAGEVRVNKAVKKAPVANKRVLAGRLAPIDGKNQPKPTWHTHDAILPEVRKGRSGAEPNGRR